MGRESKRERKSECLCVCEREREREREIERERGREIDGKLKETFYKAQFRFSV